MGFAEILNIFQDYNVYITEWVKKKFTRLEGCGISNMRPIFETKISMYQSKAKLAAKILFGNITNLIDPEIKKMIKGICLRTKLSHSILVHDLLAIEIEIHF